MKKLTLQARRASILRARKIWHNKLRALKAAQEAERAAWTVFQELKTHHDC